MTKSFQKPGGTNLMQSAWFYVITTTRCLFNPILLLTTGLSQQDKSEYKESKNNIPATNTYCMYSSS